MKKTKTCVGWCEWVQLPALAIGAIEAKVDTGAKTCALHADEIETYTAADQQVWVKFVFHSRADRADPGQQCHAPLLEQRRVKNSSGQDEERYVIVTVLTLGGETFECEITLSDRRAMQFPMLLGRNALSDRFIVDPSRSYLLPRPAALKNSDNSQEKL